VTFTPAARRWLWAVLLGAAGLWLNSFDVPLLTEDTPSFVFGGVAVLLAFVALGNGPGLLAGTISLASVWSLDPAGLATTVYVLEAAVIARLRRRSGSLVFAAMAYWLTVGLLLDVAVYGGLVGLSRDYLGMLLLKQVLNGVFNAVLVEGALLLPSFGPRFLPLERQPLPLREHVFRRVALAVMVPALVLALVYTHSTFDRQVDGARRRAQAVARTFALAVHDFLEVRGHRVEALAREIEAAGGTRGGRGEQILERFQRSRPDVHFVGLVSADGVVAASLPADASPSRPRVGQPFAWRDALAKALLAPEPRFVGNALWDIREAGAGYTEPAVLVLVPLLDARGHTGQAVFAALCSSSISATLADIRGEPAQVLTLFDAQRSVIGTLDRRLRPGRALGAHFPVAALASSPTSFSYHPPPEDAMASRLGLDLRHSTYEAVEPPGWGVVVDVPAESLHAEIARSALSVLAFFAATLLLLYFSVSRLAKQIGGPLQRVDETAGAIAAGGYGTATRLGGLELSPIVEVRNLAAHFLRMERALTAHDELALAALRESEERYRKLVELSPDAILVEAAEGIVYCNAAALRLLGARRVEDVTGRSLISFLHADDVKASRERMAKIFETGEACAAERRFPRAAGGAAVAEIAATGFQHAGRPAALVVARDITERRRAEGERARFQGAIEQAASEWRETFDAIDTPVLLLDRALRISRLNRAASDLAGRSFDDSLGQPLGRFGKGEPWREAASQAARLLAGAGAAAGTARDEGSGRSWDVEARRVPRGDKADERLILVVRETTALVQLQDTLRRRETMSAMGALVAGVAHEVRNPLFAISATLDAAELRLVGHAGSEPHMRVLRSEVERLSGLMEDLLEYGRPQAQAPEMGSLTDLVTEAITLVGPHAAQAGVAIEPSLARGLPVVTMDHRRMLQVFKNVVENAVQHSPRGSRVFVRLGAASRSGAEWIECAVRDAGPGFALEDLPRVFEPFFTRRRGGTGLGLSIVQRVVDEHGGSVEIRNHEDGGAVVTVRLLAARAETAAAS
jgi:PAS domain S-box-containing protein